MRPVILLWYEVGGGDLFLNSFAGTIQAEKWSHGAAFDNITQEDFGYFVIPLISMPEQQRLHGLMMQAEATRRQAHTLLDRAKRTVEIVIEKSGEDAISCLEQYKGVKSGQ